MHTKWLVVTCYFSLQTYTRVRTYRHDKMADQHRNLVVVCKHTVMLYLLQDQLTTTSDSYEKQLSAMSDHLCELNDKILRQADELESSRRTKVCSLLISVTF